MQTPWLLLPDPAATRRLGALLGERLTPGITVALHGDLGAGKTCLVKAAVASLGEVCEEDVVSPTFVLAAEYPGRIEVLHLDAYRLSGPEALDDLGFCLEEMPERAVFVEWAERVEAALPVDRLSVELEHAPGGGRLARLEAGGARTGRLLAGLADELAAAGFLAEEGGPGG